MKCKNVSKCKKVFPDDILFFFGEVRCTVREVVGDKYVSVLSAIVNCL